METYKKHNWETQVIGEHKLGTVCTKCGILKTEFDKMVTDKSDCIYIDTCVQRVHGKSLTDSMKCKKNCSDYEPIFNQNEKECSCDITFVGDIPITMNECDYCKNKRENE